ncbi:MAG: 3'(2'),5'-bisphosphate nucleotidase CysQ [Alphaproteobacteria bacterium]|jgi:myo-inositol-1(or 4)-monophosphatase|nr:3'(2'),5'-bisphosphate nucleotidase CysQ [Alphaproteobacteria bacterium]
MSVSADLDLLMAATREGGALALDHFKAGVTPWDKKPDDPVSEADLAVDRLLHERLQGARSDYGWLSEESVDDPRRLDCARVWVVDPIDGTRAFVARRPEFCVCAALVEQGEPVLAAVFNPATDEFFAAVRGQGATLNGRPIHASGRDDLNAARLLASKSRHFSSPAWQEAAPGASFSYRNSIAYRMVLVAAGRFETAISLTPKSDWDIAAADLIVREAGARATTATGAAFRYNQPRPVHPNVITSGPGVHGQVLDLLAEAA